MTQILTSLFWLLIHVRSDLKVLLVTYKIVSGHANSYLSDFIRPFIPSLSPIYVKVVLKLCLLCVDGVCPLCRSPWWK